MDPIKEAFQKIKEEMSSLKEEITFLKGELNKFSNQTNPSHNLSMNDPILDTPTQTPTLPQEMMGSKTINNGLSTGNEGVPTDKPTNQQTNQQTNKPTTSTHFQSFQGKPTNMTK